MRYQTHSPDQKGMTDSSHRLGRLKIPDNLTGQAVLDMGCNEGFFCNVAASRGASRVVGIDMSSSALAIAKELYGGDGRVQFIEQGWQKLPQGPFDLVLWTSAMHYELDPLHVLQQVAASLSPNGVLILECGVNYDHSKEMTRIQRHDGALWYPSLRFLEEHLLAGFAFRQIATPELVGSDPIPRSIYHCAKKMPEVVLLRGPTGKGKSVAATAMSRAATKIISLDMFLSRMMTAKHQHSELEKYIFSKARPYGLTEVYEGIDEVGLTNAYIGELAKGVAGTDGLVVIDGYMTDQQATALRAVLSTRAKVWDAG
ncbi:class I SAM-dependent methyltransferase [Aminobacter sp. HY435]|uniref:class I SAM-dependent methyltransferase n=1 Tax=Aminobacter sp. HY435 TaxID=2970917 RepID=UPI0022B9C4EB|nr:class I SAM-dependent methyltransferase [Aminobacter sp. HY435]